MAGLTSFMLDIHAVLHRLETALILKECFLVGIDDVSLYTSIPHKVRVQVVAQWLEIIF